MHEWSDGNHTELLESGDAFFPRVFDAIREARDEILLETFILFDDQVGRDLQRLLMRAARRGVQVEITVDGYGSANLPPDFIGSLQKAGVCLHVFDPQPKLLGMRTNLFRRMHRKVLVIDRRIAFVGGINFGKDHLSEIDHPAMIDFALQVEGPVVARIHAFMRKQMTAFHGTAPDARDSSAGQAPRRTDALPGAEVHFVTRDNEKAQTSIEEQYLRGIQDSRHQLIVVNAFFFPSYRLVKAMIDASRRGVNVRLVLQGRSGGLGARLAARTLYAPLQRANVHILEYDKPLHAKVAVADDDWCTVGSSNLDPLSLALNLEANLFVRHPGLSRQLRHRLELLIQHDTREVGTARGRLTAGLRLLVGSLGFHLSRRFPAWAGWLPAHQSKLVCLPPSREADAQQNA